MPYYNKVGNNVEVILDNGEIYSAAQDWESVRQMFGFEDIYCFTISVIPLPNQQFTEILSNANGVMQHATGGGVATVTIGPISSLQDEGFFNLIIKADELPGGGVPTQDPE